MSARHLRRAKAVADDYSFSHRAPGQGGGCLAGTRYFDPSLSHLRRCSLSLDSIPDSIIRQIHSVRSTSNSPQGGTCSPGMRALVPSARERAMTFSESPRSAAAAAAAAAGRWSHRQTRPLFRNRTMDGPSISITVSEPEGVDRLVKRTQSDSDACQQRGHEAVKSRSRSVNFFGEVEDNPEKKRLQRTPTPYWSRKEMNEDASADEDGIDYTPNYDPPDWDEGSGSSSLAAPRLHRPSSPGEETGSSVESLSRGEQSPDPGAPCGGGSEQIKVSSADADNITAVPEAALESSKQEPEVRQVAEPGGDGAGDVPELYRNPLFRKVLAGYSGGGANTSVK